MGETKANGNGKKNGAKANQFQEGACDRCLWAGKYLSEMKGTAHCHKAKRSRSFPQIVYGIADNCGKRQAKH